jgi:hypothetical protein
LTEGGTVANTIYVDELVDRQKLTGRNYFVLGLLLVALLCDGFDLQLVAVSAPWLTEAGSVGEPVRHDAWRDCPRQPR